MLKKIKIEACILVALLLGLFLSARLNIDLNTFFNNFNIPLNDIFLKKFFIKITTLGNSLWYFAFSIIFFIFIHFLKQNKNLLKYKENLRQLNIINSLLFLSILLSGILTQILKHIIGRPRPNMANINNYVEFNFFSLDSNFHSFPSGHTATIFAVALTFSIIAPRLKYFFYFLASLAALSRVVVGAHYITDIIAGICIALIGFKLSYIILEKIKIDNFKTSRLVIFNNKIVLVLIAISLLAVFLSIGPTLDIYVSGWFYLGEGEFLNQSYYNLTIFVRKIILYFILFYILILPAVSMILPIKQIYFGYNFKLKDLLYLWSTIIFNLIIFINLILKNFWGRARPNEIIELGGQELFSPWYEISNNCNTNCSFVSGDAAVGFSLIIFFFLIKKEIYFNLALFLGVGIGLIRISEGGHFLSDIIMSCFFVFSFTFIAHYYYFRKENA